VINEAIGQVLSFGVGVALSPVPIVSVVLMLGTPRARSNGPAFVIGWIVGLAAVGSIVLLVSSGANASENGEPANWVNWLKLALGLVLLLIAVKQWRGRPAGGDQAQLPKWMQAVETFTPPKAAGLGVLLSAVNPKNLLLAASAGVTIGAAGLDAGSIVVVIAVFTLIAASTVLVPVVGYLLAADKLRGPLDALRGWLAKENAVIMAVLLLVIGVAIIGKGIGSF
jgi:threonine/homoserine/homoserine lactone efflux protein